MRIREKEAVKRLREYLFPLVPLFDFGKIRDKTTGEILGEGSEELMEIIKTHLGFKKWKSLYLDWEKELISLSNEIYSEYLHQAKKYHERILEKNVPPPFLEPPPSLEEIINRKISETLQKEKNEQKAKENLKRLHRLYKDEFPIKKRDENTISKKIENILPLTKKEKRVNQKEREITSIIKELVAVRLKTGKIKPKLIEKLLAVTTKRNSIYDLAKTYKLNRQKLTYVLRKIQQKTYYPLLTEDTGVNFVDKLGFETIYPFLKNAWEKEENCKKWRDILKKGFTKSRATHFMERKIKGGIVPIYYFDIVPPTKENISYIMSKRRPINLSQEVSEKKTLPHKKILEEWIPSFLTALYQEMIKSLRRQFEDMERKINKRIKEITSNIKVNESIPLGEHLPGGISQ